MSYLALYRQWRPTNFSEILGQEHVGQTLKNALRGQKIRHAYLFSGPRGTGKTSTAKVLAKAVNCLEPVEGEPCNQCVACRRISEGASLDVLELDAASNRGIDEIRELRENVKFSAAEERYKVYIIDEVHMLTQEAFNALLKTLEEPPGNVIFVLATTEPQKLPLTIISRCQRFDFRRIPDQVIFERMQYILDQGNTAFEPQALQLIARVAEGGLRDALSLLDQCLTYGDDALTLEQVAIVVGTVTNDILGRLVDELSKGNMGESLGLVDRLIADGKEVIQCTRDLLQYCRNLLLIKNGAAPALFHLSSEEREKLSGQAQGFSDATLWQLVEILKNAEQEMRWSRYPRISLELALVKFINEAILPNSQQPQNQISKTMVKGEEEAPPVKSREREIASDAPVQAEGGLAVDQIRLVWPEILKRVKGTKVTTFAFLVQGKPLSFEGNLLQLVFDDEYRFHKEKMDESENIKVLEQVLEEVLGQKIKAKAMLDGDSGEETTQSASASSSSDLVQRAVEIFGGDIVEVEEDT